MQFGWRGWFRLMKNERISTDLTNPSKRRLLWRNYPAKTY